jgi:hypothetical protein
MEPGRDVSLVASQLCGCRLLSYEHELLVGRVRGNPWGPRRELMSTRDGRIILLRTGRRNGATATEWEVPYTPVQQYWGFKTSAGEGGPTMGQVTLVSGGERFTVSLDAEDGENLLIARHGRPT